jgi:hypothetical protein
MPYVSVMMPTKGVMNTDITFITLIMTAVFCSASVCLLQYVYVHVPSSDHVAY